MTSNPPIRANLHGNVRFQPRRIRRLTNLPRAGGSVSPSERRRVGQRAIMRVLAEAEREPRLPVRAIGAGWSLSRAADTSGWLIQTEDLAFTKTQLRQVHPRSPFAPTELAWVQCGTRVAQLNSKLGAVGRSLLTCGASNGQTIVGASATGTHGSAFGVGSMHDTIRGMHIVCASDRSVWLEPASAPVLPEGAARRAFGDQVELIRDDEVFHAALVSFGSFGIVESVVIETAPLFLLSVHRERRPWDAALMAKTETLALDEERGGPGQLHHFDVIFDPLELATGGALRPWVTTIYKTPAPRGYRYAGADEPKQVLITDPAAVHWAGVGARLAPKPVLERTSKLLDERFALLDGSDPVPLGVLFTDIVMDALGASTEIGVPIGHTPRAVSVIAAALHRAYQRNQPFLGPMALRFVRASKALLAFTHFGPATCCIELPGARMPWTEALYREVFEALDRADVPFALHWGQENDLGRERMRRSYGSQRIARWRRARARVLPTAELRARFANAMVERCGLDG